ncbi:MAG TPA: chitobiase/beta-hexosaminidase C-terminal domain-containing protein [Spirochaetota bacterium]|nr:chitobiase/beta-hexosaminidase C-terminal domain-containing protein [Spirochaetota bacterium]HOS32652.1 chitobiase/beta-hexosaminidase C-terminal domain-containing protein [Spirochaetota bacterium]
MISFCLTSLLASLLLSASIICGGCSFLNSDDVSAELPKKSISVKIESAYRNTVVSSYTITATKSGEDDVVVNTSNTTTSLTLTYGEWNISVVGKNSSSVVVCDGNKSVTVNSGTSSVVIGVAYKTGGIKCNYSYDIAGIVSKIKITATRSGYTTISNQISVDTSSLSGAVYLFDALPGSWNVLVEAMNASNAVYYSKSFTATVAESGLFTNSSALDQKIATAPVFSVAGGTYTSDQSISLSTTTSGASIYYTTNGNNPTSGSALYTAPISVAGSGTSMTIKAITIKSGLTSSSIVTNAYTINYPDCAAPTFSPNSGSFTSATNVTITSATTGATIHYTTNGDTPTTGSPSISNGSSITLSTNGTYTVKAIAVKSGYDNSAVGSSGSITINYPDCATPTFSPNSGSFTSATNVTITSATTGATIHYTTNGDTPTTGSPSISNGSSITLSTNGTYTVKAIAVKSGYDNSAVGSSGSIVINISLPNCVAPVITSYSTLTGNNTESQPDSISITITSETSGATIYYTTDGLAPTTSSTQYSAPFDISGNTTIKAIAVKSGYNNSGVTTKIYKKTVVQTTYDAGYGNYLLIKGAGGPLGSWDSQYIMKWTTGNVWYWVTWEDFGSSTFTFKCFTNYGTWMPDPNRTGNVGETNYSAW